MPNAVWTGSLSLGMVVVPVRLYPAIRKKAVRFHELDRGGRRVRHVRVSEPNTEWEPPALRLPERAPWPEPVPAARDDVPKRPSPIFEAATPEVAFEEIRKGYEVAPGQYVSMSPEEVTALAPERSRVIDVEQFVDVSAVDPIYFESRYYVVPDRDWSSPFRLLRQAMAAADRMAIAWFTMRSRRYLSAVRPYGDVMLLTTMVHADEIVGADFWIPDADSSPTDKELKMARLLIDTLSGPFEPERYPDDHRRRVLDAIEAKAPTAAVAAAPASPTRVLDLMATLEASVKAAKAARTKEEGQTKSRRRRSIGT
ncbi:MAG TPA: Ku protein [Candidatus Dormibacteraeota bacterium]|nr:Ku protein [Candidatus Dormibacteraeota bacterium]